MQRPTSGLKGRIPQSHKPHRAVIGAYATRNNARKRTQRAHTAAVNAGAGILIPRRLPRYLQRVLLIVSKIVIKSVVMLQVLRPRARPVWGARTGAHVRSVWTFIITARARVGALRQAGREKDARQIYKSTNMVQARTWRKAAGGLGTAITRGKSPQSSCTPAFSTRHCFSFTAGLRAAHGLEGLTLLDEMAGASPLCLANCSPSCHAHTFKRL